VLVVADVDDEVLEGDADEVELESEGLDAALPVAEVREDADALGEPDLLLLADLLLVGDADEIADRIADAEALASAAPGPWRAALFAARDSTVLFGISGHAEWMIGLLLASAA
jgi:hypothetical protein